MRAKNLSKGTVAFHNSKRTKKLSLSVGETYEFKDVKEYQDFLPDMVHFQKENLLEVSDKPLAKAAPKAQPKPKPEPKPKPKAKEVTLKGEAKK